MTRVLSIASECAPLVKTGGLADVAGALPTALAETDVEMRTLLPGYPAVMAAMAGAEAEAVRTEPDLFGGRGRVWRARIGALALYVLEAPHLYDRPGNPYLGPDGRDWPDNPERFAALCWTAAQIADEGTEGWRPQVLHLHDWQAGLTPVYLQGFGVGSRVGTVMTVHNVAFAGLAGPERIGTLRLPPSGYHPEGFEFYGRISALKAGLMGASRITTVSPTYARELMTPAFGMGLDGVFRARASAVTGILNGIDESAWNPATDPEIETFRGASGKKKARAALIAEMGLDAEAPGPLCVMVSRLTEQKGVDLLIEALPALLERGGQLALLGSGAAELEAALRRQADHPRVALRLGYDEGLSHRIIAGGDAILVPSRFEPCGLTQLYGLRYGTIPVVARTGGLADTVIHANAAALAAGVATGIAHAPDDAEALANALADLCTLHASPHWAKMQRRAMAQPVGWGPSATTYAALYAEIAGPA